MRDIKKSANQNEMKKPNNFDLDSAVYLWFL